MTLAALVYFVSVAVMFFVFLVVGYISWEYERATVTTTDIMLAVFAVFCPVLNTICLACLICYLGYHGINMITFPTHHD